MKNLPNDKHQELQEYIDQMKTLNVKLGLDGKILLVGKNSQVASGLSMDQLMKTNFLDGPWWSFNPETQKRVKAAFKKAISGTPTNYNENMKIKGPDGKPAVIIINFNLTPVFGNDGKPKYLVAEGQDITKLKQLEKKLEETTKNLELMVIERTKELKEKVKTLEKFQKLTIGRELKMIELKNKIKKSTTNQTK